MIGDEIGVADVAAGIGVLFAARGIGSGLGPIVARAVLRERSQWPFYLGGLVSLCGLFYVLVALIEWTPWITILVLLAHAASGATISTVNCYATRKNRRRLAWKGVRN